MWADVAGQIIRVSQTRRNKAENHLRIDPSYLKLLVRWQYSASSLRGQHKRCSKRLTVLSCNAIYLGYINTDN
ncbi:hypothetical protein HMPREF1144_3061 [Klebsiella sp. OBRC7]|nr:hypothetical protein HMPREF1144_3061 [Klebsiella sp. OBRC7]